MFERIDSKIRAIVEKACSDIPLSKDEVLALIKTDEASMEADAIRQAGRYVSRKRFGRRAMLLCQTGVEAFPCSADCQFCSFGKSHFSEELWKIPEEGIHSVNRQMTGKGVFSHFLLFMHNSLFETLLSSVEKAKKSLPKGTNLVLNCGDLEHSQVAELKSAGVTGFYHVMRLGEEIDTTLKKKDRIQTIEFLKQEGLDWYTCCEPVGPEHSAEEIAEQIWLSRELSCFQNAVMRRICVTSAMSGRGRISLLRSAQLVAVVALAMVGNKELSSIAVHEPDLLGLYAGANCIYAEFGVNPRDTEKETSKSRGFSIEKCRDMLKDSGFVSLMQAGGEKDILLQ